MIKYCFKLSSQALGTALCKVFSHPQFINLFMLIFGSKLNYKFLILYATQNMHTIDFPAD